MPEEEKINIVDLLDMKKFSQHRAKISFCPSSLQSACTTSVVFESNGESCLTSDDLTKIREE